MNTPALAGTPVLLSTNPCATCNIPPVMRSTLRSKAMIECPKCHAQMFSASWESAVEAWNNDNPFVSSNVNVPQIMRKTQKSPTLTEAQRFVGGYVASVPIRDGSILLVNEDGLSKRLPENHIATTLAGFKVVGNVIVLSGSAKRNWV